MYHDPGWDGMLLQGYIDSKNMGTCFDTYLYATYKKTFFSQAKEADYWRTSPAKPTEVIMT